MEQTLKKCPFCGGNGTLSSNYSQKASTFLVFVKCDMCGSQGRFFFSRDIPAIDDYNNEACKKAVNAWNLRTTTD